MSVCFQLCCYQVCFHSVNVQGRKAVACAWCWIRTDQLIYCNQLEIQMFVPGVTAVKNPPLCSKVVAAQHWERVIHWATKYAAWVVSVNYMSVSSRGWCQQCSDITACLSTADWVMLQSTWVSSRWQSKSVMASQRQTVWSHQNHKYQSKF